MPPPEKQSTRRKSGTIDKPKSSFLLRFASGMLGAVLAILLSTMIAAGIALALAYPNVPDVDTLTHYRPKQPLRIYTSDEVLIGEYGQERRSLTPIEDIPPTMKAAVLAVEDARFYEHSGVDYVGVARAAMANLTQRKSQGASTITMQVARNMYLSSEKTYTRKLYELLLALKIEHSLSKDQILEIYMNQIYLGNRAYGFATAARTYFGKSLKDVTLAEAAMLAGIPKAPSSSNPIANFGQARKRQLHVLHRMAENGFITEEEAEQAAAEDITTRSNHSERTAHTGFVAEMARQAVYEQYGDQSYSRGLNVYTSIDSKLQADAYAAVRKAIVAFSSRQAYRGPERFIKLPPAGEERDQAIEETLSEFVPLGGLEATVVTEMGPSKLVVVRQNGEAVTIEGKSDLIAVWSGMLDHAGPDVRIRPGAVVRIMKDENNHWISAQLPDVEGALIALDPRDGAIKALVGGFDFKKNEFNHVTQAWRQPGSSFKPFIYSAALEKGFTPASIIDDGPLYFGPEVTGGKPWVPKNYGGGFRGPMSLERGLELSRNMIAIRVLQSITPRFGQEWATRFGFDAAKNPPYLPLALGSGAATPLQLAAAYGVFANGGHQVKPYLITRITDQAGTILTENKPTALEDLPQVISARNAFTMDRMLQGVVQRGTAAKASSLGRHDLHGKTGTTNESVDAWFAGYQPTLVAATWMGYDSPRNLGPNATGGGLSLPVWMDFMGQALKGVPEATPAPPPEGLTRVGDAWIYSEYTGHRGITNLHGAGLEPEPDDFKATPAQPDSSSERSRILDMFKD